MRTIYLLRHGIALPHGTPGVPEDDRPLTAQGVSRLKRIAEGLDRLGIAPDRVVTSPLPRARQTAGVAAGALGLSDRLENADVLRPGQPARSIRDWLATRPEETILLVGHNPNLTELLGLLIGLPGGNLPFELKKGGLAALKDGGRGGYLLHWLATPRLVRKLLG